MRPKPDINNIISPQLNINSLFEPLKPFDNRIEKESLKKSQITKARVKRRNTINMKREALKEFLTELPEKGEQFHIVSNGKFDYFSFLPVIIELSCKVDEFYGSTWTINRENTNDLLSLIDQKLLNNVTVITGIYFKRRERAVYATLLNWLESRNMRFAALENHTKIMLIKNNSGFFVIEGSANWTSNPRIEQNILVNDENIYNFHKSWIDSIFKEK